MLINKALQLHCPGKCSIKFHGPQKDDKAVHCANCSPKIALKSISNKVLLEQNISPLSFISL
jgi:hypothetical protein